MVVCRFFQQGWCRYGDSCRFEHIYSQKYAYHGANSNTTNTTNAAVNLTNEQAIVQFVNEVNISIKSGQWILSCFGSFKNRGNFPGLDDISPEELRLSLYEARSNGTTVQNQTLVGLQYQNAMEKLKALSKPTAALTKIIDNFYKGDIVNDPFVSNFSNPIQSTNVFGVGASGAPNVNVFGSGNHNTTSSNVSGNIFANAAQTLFQNASNSMFGATTNVPFGASTNVFSSQPDQVSAKNIFGGTPFENGFKEQSLLFGVNNSQTINTATSQIPTSPFGSSLSQSNLQNPTFGQPPQSEISPSALFGAANASLQQTISPNEVQGNVFGQPNKDSLLSSQNPFGASTSPFLNTGTNVNSFASNIFGNQQASTDPSVINNEIYSQNEILSEQDLIAFQSETFSHGFIPELAPPVSLCTYRHIEIKSFV